MEIPEGEAFIRRWGALGRRDRARLRRLVRLGRPMTETDEAVLAVGYANYQRARPWNRFFWVWFAPGLVVALGIAGSLHPILVGVVLALAAQAVFAQRNLRRAEQLNAPLLGAGPGG